MCYALSEVIELSDRNELDRFAEIFFTKVHNSNFFGFSTRFVIQDFIDFLCMFS